MSRTTTHPFAVTSTALLVWLLAAALLGGAYVASAWLGYGLTGFPLDDAWIHQTYARNLGTSGEWAFVPGEVSAGSTAPLWSLLLALGYRLGIPYLVWTHGLGVAALGVSAWLAAGLTAAMLPGHRRAAWLGGLACLAEWHLVWAAVSGMETVLTICLALAVVRLVSTTSAGPAALAATTPPRPGIIWPWRYVILGLTGALLVLTRPEGLVLVGLAVLSISWALRRAWRRLPLVWAATGVGLALPLLPYLAFHCSVTGQPFPTTFYAKQEEYRALIDMLPVWQRWLTVAGATLIGGQVLLLPGFVWAIVRAVSARHRSAQDGSEFVSGTSPPSQTSPPCPLSTEWRGGDAPRTILLLALWWLAHVTLYALRLPVTYQHGRYQMPVIAALVIVGLCGSVHLLDRVRHPVARRVVSRAGLLAAGLLWAAFLVIGARAYATDVGFVHGEMVTTAHWLAENTPEDSLIAAHDIGAVGYFAQRRLLDLAGLITPEVVPIIHDDAALMTLMQSRHVDYVVFFPDWSAAYRRLAGDPRLRAVYSTNYAWTQQAGHANMVVYRLETTPSGE
jgi:arabinofuranosyltransferase